MLSLFVSGCYDYLEKTCEFMEETLFDAPPSSLMDSAVNLKVKTIEGGSWGTLLGSQHFGGKRACWSSRIGTRMSDKQVNYSHKPTQTKQ